MVIDGEQAGPYAPSQLGEMLSAGTVTWEAYVWCEGFDNWAPMRDVPDLVSQITGQGGGQAAAEPAYAHAATATLTVTVGAPPPPAPADDSITTPQGVAVTLTTLGNDGLSTEGAPLVPASVLLEDPVDSAFKSSVAIADQGLWSVDSSTGDVTFTPVPTFTGPATPVTYRVSDTNGASAQAVESVVVSPVSPARATRWGLATSRRSRRASTAFPRRTKRRPSR